MNEWTTDPDASTNTLIRMNERTTDPLALVICLVVAYNWRFFLYVWTRAHTTMAEQVLDKPHSSCKPHPIHSENRLPQVYFHHKAFPGIPSHPCQLADLSFSQRLLGKLKKLNHSSHSAWFKQWLMLAISIPVDKTYSITCVGV